jgi:aldose 1-epimerase
MRFGTTIDRHFTHPVIHLTDLETGCRAEIYAFGGLLNSFNIPHGNERVNVVDGFVSVDAAVENITRGFRSAKLSPYVCRMNHGQYQFENKSYTVEKFLLSGHAIHGLLYDAVFNVTAHTADEENAAVSLQYDYPGSDPGYPFPYTIAITWKLANSNSLTATTKIINRHTHPIPVADGWHPYFNLGGKVDGCTLKFNSDMQLEYTADLLPTGRAFTDNRFTNGILLKGIELDNSFLLDTSANQPHCVLQNEEWALSIRPGNNYAILQVYIPPHRNSIAIENLSGAPDNFNNKMGLIELGPGEEKEFEVNYSVTGKQAVNY